MKYRIHPAVIAVWAAVVAAGHFVPTIPLLGTSGTFSLSSALAPLSGIFFGPIAGAICSAIGGFIGSLIAPYTAWMGPFTFIVGTTVAFTSGCIAYGKWPPVNVSITGNFIINGGIIVYLIGTILWFTQEIGRSFVWFPIVFYGLGFCAALAGIFFSGRILTSSSRFIKLPVIWLCSFGGLVGGASIGNFFGLVLFKQPKEIWEALTIIAPLERIFFAIGSAIIGLLLIEGLNKIGIRVGPDSNEQLAIR